MSVKEALAKYGDAMTPYERKEILQYQEDHVYYLGLEASANKVINDETLPNDGFDDDNGSYIKVIHDHIAYRYEILQVIGRGSFGQVVKARDHKTNTDVALKIIRNKKRFHQQALIEVKILEHLNRCCDQANQQQQQLQQQILQQQQQLSGSAGQPANGSTGSTSSSSNSSPSSSNYSLSSSSSSLMSSPLAQAAANSRQSAGGEHQAPGKQQQQQQQQHQFNNTNAGCQFVIQMIDNFYFRNHLCITFELLNMNLYELIKRNSYQGFSLNLIRKFAYSLVQCLRMLNREKIIHCDLKPENILLRDRTSSSIKVIDFGSSCFTSQRIYTYIQSRFYRSPEVILGLPYGTPIDMWSLACILAELYTGEPLFAGENESDQLGCIMEVCSLPPTSVLEAATRRRLFFDSKNNPRNLVNSKDRRRRVGSRPLSVILNCDETDFIDFLERCLEWDPRLRLTPDEAIRHPWLAHYVRRVVGGFGAGSSALVAHHQVLNSSLAQAPGAQMLTVNQIQPPAPGPNLSASSGVSSGGSDTSNSSATSNKSLFASANMLEGLRLNVGQPTSCNGQKASATSVALQKASLLQRNLVNFTGTSTASSGSTVIQQQKQQPMQQDSLNELDEHQAMEIDCNNNNPADHQSLKHNSGANTLRHQESTVQLGKQNHLNYQQQQSSARLRHFSTANSVVASQAPQRGLLSVVGAGANEHQPFEAGPVACAGTDLHQLLTGNNNPKQAIINANKQFISASQQEQQDTYDNGKLVTQTNPLNRINRDPSGNVVRRVSCVAAPASNLLVSNGESCVNTIVSSSMLADSTGGPLSSGPASTLTVASCKFGGSGGLSIGNCNSTNGHTYSTLNLSTNGKLNDVKSATCVIRDSHLMSNKSQTKSITSHQQQAPDSSASPMDMSSGSKNLINRQRKTSLQHFGLANGQALKRDALPHSSSAKSLYRLGEDDGNIVVSSSTTNSTNSTNNSCQMNCDQQQPRPNGKQHHFDFNNYHRHLSHFASNNSSHINQSPSSVSLSSMKISTPTNGNSNQATQKSSSGKVTEADLKLSLDQVQMMLNQAASNGRHHLVHYQASNDNSNNNSNSNSNSNTNTNLANNHHVSLINSAKQIDRVIDNLVNRKNSLGSSSINTSNSGNYFRQQPTLNVNTSSNNDITSTSANNATTQHKQPRAIVKRNPYIASEQFKQWTNQNDTKQNSNIDTTTNWGT